MDDLSRARSEIFGPAIAELAEADELTALGAHLREEQSIRGKSIVVVAFSANFSASFSAISGSRRSERPLPSPWPARRGLIGDEFNAVCLE